MPPPSKPTAIVTGAASGIGLAIAKQLIDQGYEVAAVDCDGSRLSNAADLFGSMTTPHTADVSHADAWRGLIGELKTRWNRLDLLVNNAGVLAGGELCGSSVEATQRVLDVNLRGAMLGCQIAGPWMIDSAAHNLPQAPQGGPLPGVINIASIFAALAPPGFAAYSASKAGLVALSEALREELSPHGLNVTVALPGTTPTSLFAAAEYSDPRFQEAVDEYQKTCELTPDVVAAQVLRAAAEGRRQVVIGRRARRLALLRRLAPTATHRRIAEQARRRLGLPHRRPGEQN